MVDTGKLIGMIEVRLQDLQNCDLLDGKNLLDCILLDISWSQIKRLNMVSMGKLEGLNVSNTFLQCLNLTQ